MLIHIATGLIVVWSNKLNYLNSSDLKWNGYGKITGVYHMFLRLI